MIVASAGNVLVWIVWFAAAFACLGSAVAVISFTNPFFSALALIGNLGSLAVMYLLLSAEFVAAAQVLVYAGAVVVMFLFVIAYVGPRRETPWSGGPSWQTFGAVARGRRAARGDRRRRRDAGERQPLAREHVGADFGTPAWIGRLFLVDHLLAFEITSVVLLIAAVGGVILGSHTRRASHLMDGPNVAWYIAIAAFLFGIGALGVLIRRNTLVVLLSLELMLNGGQPRADRALAPLRRTARARSSRSP